MRKSVLNKLPLNRKSVYFEIRCEQYKYILPTKEVISRIKHVLVHFFAIHQNKKK